MEGKRERELLFWKCDLLVTTFTTRNNSLLSGKDEWGDMILMNVNRMILFHKMNYKLLNLLTRIVLYADKLRVR